MDSSSDDDIEVISIERHQQLKQPKTQTEFILSELGLSSPSGIVREESVKKVMEKYEIEATSDQIKDMVSLANTNKVLSRLLDDSTI